MCNPDAIANIQRMGSSMMSTMPNASTAGPNTIPSAPIGGVGASTASPNGMPATQGGPQSVAMMAQGAPSPQIGLGMSAPGGPGAGPGAMMGMGAPQMPPQLPPSIPGAGSVPPGAPGAPMPPPGGIARLMAGGPHPNGRGKQMPTR